MKQSAIRRLGAIPCEEGVCYRVWAPGHSVALAVQSQSGELRSLPMKSHADGYHTAKDLKGGAGEHYFYILDGKLRRPDPASRFQPDSVHGPSLVVDPRIFPWSDTGWKIPSIRDFVIYELHIGAFTPEGTFRAAIEKLPYIKDLGVSAVEVMPIADFPGQRNWGYDGVYLFAPARAYGTPEDFRSFVNAAHAHGLAVILDVVYNHFGPDGNYLRDFSPWYFEKRHKTPWGEAINFGDAHSRPVRDFYLANIDYWIRDFHIDAFRLDATHSICDDSPRHILAEMAQRAQKQGRIVIAEDERNEAALVTPRKDGGFGLDGVWADDFHHIVQTAVTPACVYAPDYQGTDAALREVLEHGFFYHGQKKRTLVQSSGSQCRHLSPERFVFGISNHDQCGNRPLGERLNHLCPPEAYRAASLLLCLSPYTPLLFMGQEWSASTPFLYFTDHEPMLGKCVEKGRKRDLERFPIYSKIMKSRPIPSPQSEEAFLASRLRWEERSESGHAQCLALYRDALELRKSNSALRPNGRTGFHIELISGVIAIWFLKDKATAWLVLSSLTGVEAPDPAAAEAAGFLKDANWKMVLASNMENYGGSRRTEPDNLLKTLAFEKPETVLLRKLS